MNNKKNIFLKHSLWLIGGLSSVLAQSALAFPEQERVYLLQLLHQINAVQLTVLAAQKECSPDARVQFHYTAYQDAKGQSHNGLSEDLILIQSGIEEKLNSVTIEPRTIQPISGDYLEDRHSQEEK